MRCLYAALVALVIAAQGQAAEVCTGELDSSRIAVAGGSITEILYFLGAQDRIVAVDTTSTYPESATGFPSMGYVRALSAEGVLSVQPTLVLGENDMGPAVVLSQIAETGIPVRRIPHAWTSVGILEKVRCVATILNRSDEAEQLIADRLAPIIAELDHLVSNAGVSARAALILDARGGSLISAGRGTSGDGLLAMSGATNMFSEFSGWKPISPEVLLSANADFIVFSVTSAQPTTQHRFPFPAYGEGRKVISMDAMEMLGFGPRTLDAALKLARIIHPADQHESS